VFDQRVVGYGQSHKLNSMDFEHFMHIALQVAAQSGDEVPVGAVLVSSSGEVLATAHNLREAKSDPTSHAEIEVIRKAASDLSDWRLENTTLFVTLEPCVMCAGAIVAARIPRVVFLESWRQSHPAFSRPSSRLNVRSVRQGSRLLS